MSYKHTPEEILQIVNYLASPAGEKVFREISDKHDEYRIKLKIPEPGGTFKVKMSAGSIRELVRQVVGQEPISTPNRGIDSSIDFPPSCQLTKRLIAEHPEFLTQTGEFRAFDIQCWSDEFHRLYPDDTTYNATLAFPNVVPLGKSWIMEFRSPVEPRAFGFDRVAVISTVLPTAPIFQISENLQIVPRWAVSAAIVYERNNEIQWLHAQLIYYVGRSGELMVPPGEEFCSPMKMYPDTRDAEIQLWPALRDWFLAPCLYAHSRMNSRRTKQTDPNLKG